MENKIPKYGLSHGAIPTITIRSAKDIIEPNSAVKGILDTAASG